MALQPDGGSLPLELELRTLRVRRRAGRAPARRHAEARPRVAGAASSRRRCGSTRAPACCAAPRSSKSAKARAAQPLKAGLRAVAYLAPDSFGNARARARPDRGRGRAGCAGAPRAGATAARRPRRPRRAARYRAAASSAATRATWRPGWRGCCERIAGRTVAGGRGDAVDHLQHRLGAAARARRPAAEGRSRPRSRRSAQPPTPAATAACIASRPGAKPRDRRSGSRLGARRSRRR